MIVSLVAALLLSNPAHAAEGMWLPEQLPELGDTLSELGLELDPAQLADPMGAPLGSIVGMGFCSASFISPDGLLATNHHCVQGYLQYMNDEEHDYTSDGFLAASREDEKWVGPGSEVQVVTRITDVTDAVNKGVGRRTKDEKRERIIRVNRARLVAECEEQANTRCRVAGFFGGQEWRLIEARRLQDVRMVYAPPEMVGSYGGEIDNWMWPRHSGDFALLRAYVAPDGSAAEHADENVPYAPPQHLELNTEGVSPGDFVMVAGYPGSTYRFRSARQMRFSRDVGYPSRVALLDEALAILEGHAEADPEAAKKVSAPIGYLSNGRKYTQGMLDGFSGSDVVARKEAQEKALADWIAADPKRVARYQPVLDELDGLQQRYEDEYATSQVASWVTRGSDLLGAATTAWRWASEQEKPDLERDGGYQDRDRQRRARGMERMQQGLHLASDRDLLALFLAKSQELPADQRIGPLDAWLEAQGGVEAALDELYAEPKMAVAEYRVGLLDLTRAQMEQSEDPWVQLAIAMDSWQAPRRDRAKVETGAHRRLDPVYIEALQGAAAGPLYPDANGTLRVTYGQVKGYSPEDGLVALPQTTVAGAVAKHTGEFPFDAPERLLEAAEKREKSRWYDSELGDVPVDFLTTLDTTGGNSGSATLDSQGRFVGLIFDGNYEAMSADWLFDDEMTRSIHVDVRYMLWMLEDVERAFWILDELGVGK